MGIRRGQLEALILQAAKGANESEEGSQERLSKMVSGQQDRDARLSELVRGKQMDASSKNDMLTRQLGEAERLRGKYGPESSINVEGVSVGARDPLQSLLRKRELEKPMLTPGQEAADKDFAKEYSELQAGGGIAGAKKNLQSLQNVQDKLRDAPEPGLLGRAAGYLPDSFRAAITPEAKTREDEVKGAIQNTLRQTLGSQFTEKEGTAILNRAYDPRLSNSENLRRVHKEAESLKAQLEQKMRSAQHFERTGSLVGLGAAGSQPTSPQAVRKQYSPSRNQTKITYSDGREEVIDGKQ